MSSDDDHSSLVLQAYHYFPDLHGDVDRQALLAARRVMLRYGSGLVTFIMLCRYWNDTTTIKLVIVKKDSYLRYFGHQRLEHYLKLLLPTSYDRDEIKHMRLLACSDECRFIFRRFRYDHTFRRLRHHLLRRMETFVVRAYNQYVLSALNEHRAFA